MQELLRHTKKLSMKDRWGRTPLAEACYTSNYGLAKLLVSHAAELLLDTTDAANMMGQFAKQGNHEGIKTMLISGCDPNVRIAAIVGAFVIDDPVLSIAFNAPSQVANFDARTALHLAASEGNMVIAEALLRHTKKLSMKDRWGRTPLAEACYTSNYGLAKLLVSHAAELLLDTTDAANMMGQFAMQGDHEGIKTLLLSGCDPNVRIAAIVEAFVMDDPVLSIAFNAPSQVANFDARTVLHLAASQGNMVIAEALLNSKAQLSNTDRWSSECPAIGSDVACVCVSCGCLRSRAGSLLTLAFAASSAHRHAPRRCSARGPLKARSLSPLQGCSSAL